MGTKTRGYKVQEWVGSQSINTKAVEVIAMCSGSLGPSMLSVAVVSRSRESHGRARPKPFAKAPEAQVGGCSNNQESRRDGRRGAGQPTSTLPNRN